MIVLDGHESDQSAKFEAFCKDNNIIALNLPLHSSNLTQSLDVWCFSALKQAYSWEVEHFIKSHGNHITKVEFFMTFKAAHAAAMTEKIFKAASKEQA